MLKGADASADASTWLADAYADASAGGRKPDFWLADASAGVCKPKFWLADASAMTKGGVRAHCGVREVDLARKRLEDVCCNVEQVH